MSLDALGVDSVKEQKLRKYDDYEVFIQGVCLADYYKLKGQLDQRVISEPDITKRSFGTRLILKDLLTAIQTADIVDQEIKEICKRLISGISYLIQKMELIEHNKSKDHSDMYYESPNGLISIYSYGGVPNNFKRES